MNDIESRFLHIMNNNFVQHSKREAFAVCPRIFYENLSCNEINAMRELYSMAYKMAKDKIKNKSNIFYN